MARIEGDRWIIETEEEAQAIANLLNQPPKVNDALQEALKIYQEVMEGTALDKFDLAI